MPEYVFNSVSNDPEAVNFHAGVALVTTLLQTLSELDSRLQGPVRPLKLPKNPWDLIVAYDDKGAPISLGELINGFYASGDTYDLAVFFDALQCYAPAVEQLDESAIVAILRLSPSGAAPGYESVYQSICDAGYDAMQCVVTGGALLSLAHERWNFDHAVFECETGQVEFDHASLPSHADAIIRRKQDAARVEITRKNFAVVRQMAFPSLKWGHDVTEQMSVFPPEFLSLAFARLAKLDDIVQRWSASGDSAPETGNIIFRSESRLTMDNYGDERRFRSASGEMLTYEQHVWIDRGNRIHFILDFADHSIEIGYIGPHLRTWTY